MGQPVCNACGLYYKLHNVSLIFRLEILLKKVVLLIVNT